MNRARVRRADARDVEPILDLLTHYDQPRSDFEPWYYEDPAYRPEDSWVVEDQGQLLAHLRVYHRRLRLGATARLDVAGIGNVITAREARHHGHAAQLLHEVLKELEAQDEACSLLWTHLPAVYAQHGYGPIPEERTSGTMPAGAVAPEVYVRSAHDDDVGDLVRLEQRFDAERSGPAVRDSAFWRASRRWLHDDMLVADHGGGLVGYVRCRVEAEASTILELGAPADEVTVAVALLAAAAEPRHGRFSAVLPPSLRPLAAPCNAMTSEAPGLMGRAVSLRRLATVLGDLWAPRLAAPGTPDFVRVPVSWGGATASLRVDGSAVLLEDEDFPFDTLPLGAGQLMALVLRGCDERTLALLGPRHDLDALATIAPALDFVLWPADGF
jgi:predicted N-acetyltransferase YhbS